MLPLVAALALAAFQPSAPSMRRMRQDSKFSSAVRCWGDGAVRAAARFGWLPLAAATARILTGAACCSCSVMPVRARSSAACWTGWSGPGLARLPKVAVLRRLWQRRLSTDLSRPLDAGSVLEVTR
jgi:hypothetical protein